MAGYNGTFAADDEGTLEAPQLLETRAHPEPENPWRSALGKKSEALERYIEGRFRHRTGKRVAHARLEGSVGASEKVQRHVHAILTHP